MNENNCFPSPLELLYTAYSDERPVFSRSISRSFEKMDVLLSPLPEKDRERASQTIYEIYTENESLAFQAGVRTGVRLAKELG